MNIIVTGASRGIGYELVKMFSRNSENVIIAISRNRDKLEQLSETCFNVNNTKNVWPFAFDLKTDDFEDLKAFVASMFNQVDILVNNAGLLINKAFIQIEDEDFDAMIDVNLKQVFKTIKILFPLMTRGTHIVNISSMGGYQGSAKFPGLSVYSAAKGGLAILTECLAEEFKETGIAVNCLALGAAQTEMLEAAFPGYKAPLSAGEMASFIEEFALNGNKYFNGKILPVSVSTP